MKRTLLLTNPDARRGEAAHVQVSQALQDLGFELVADFAESPKFFADRIREYQHQVDLVVVGSGDGAVNAAIEGLLVTHLPLGIVPLGTANNLARTLGIPQTLSEACATIAQNHLQEIDLGWVNGKYFLNVAGIGLSTHINQQVDKGLKQRWGAVAYGMTALRLIFKQRRFWAEIRCQGQTLSVRTYQVTICNGRYYGSGLKVATDAAINDQRLDLCSLEIQHWWQPFLLLPALTRGEYATGQGIRILQGQEIEITTRKPYPIDTDGEITTTTPAQLKVVPRAIAVFVPQTNA